MNWVCSPQTMRILDGLHNLILHFPARPLLGLVCKADPPPIYFIPSLWRVWNLTIRFFLFLKFYSKHLGVSKRTWGLRSVLEGSPFDFWCPTFSGGGSEVAVEFCFNVHSMRSAEVFSSAWSTDHIGDICFCIQVSIFPHSRMAVFFILCSSQKLSCFLGAPIFPQVLFRTYKRCLWKSYPWFIFSLFSEKEGLLGIFHALQQA